MKNTLFILLVLVFSPIYSQVNNATLQQDSTAKSQLVKDSSSIALDSIIPMPKACHYPGKISFKSSRVDGTAYYIDGVLVKKSEFYEHTEIPQSILTPIENKRVIVREQIRLLPTRKINEIVNTSSGVQLTTKGLSFKGSREDGTAYYLDGMRLLEDPIFEVLF